MSNYDPAGVMGDIQKKQRFDNTFKAGFGQPIASPPGSLMGKAVGKRIQPQPNMIQSFFMRMFGNRAKKEGLH